MSRFAGMQYCKTDLIATKGIVFVKYSKSSSACLAMETIQQTGTVGQGSGRMRSVAQRSAACKLVEACRGWRRGCRLCGCALCG